MITHSVKSVEKKTHSSANETSRNSKRGQPAFQFADNRTESVMQKKFQEMPDQDEVAVLEKPSNNSPVHSGQKEKGFLPAAIPGKQMGTQGTLFMVASKIKEHHISIECRALDNGRVEIIGGHLTNENIPEGEAGRRVKDLTDLELAPYRKQAEEMQMQLDQKEAEQRELKRKQEQAAMLAKNRNEQTKAMRDILNAKIKNKKDREKITDGDLLSAVDNEWTPEQVKDVAGREKDVVQLAQ